MKENFENRFRFNTKILGIMYLFFDILAGITILHLKFAWRFNTLDF